MLSDEDCSDKDDERQVAIDVVENSSQVGGRQDDAVDADADADGEDE
jgi:hypothetical protein